MKLRGCGTALVTPFKQDGSLDESALRELVRWQVESGIDFLVPCGTTGETPTLTHDEWLRVVDLTIETASGRVPIMAGATSNNTREAVAKAKEISSRPGVDYILTATPYYNKPTQEGVYQHFKAIAEASTKPLMLYNIAGRTGTNIETPTLLRLAEIPNIVARERSQRQHRADCRGLRHRAGRFPGLLRRRRHHAGRDRTGRRRALSRSPPTKFRRR